MTFQLANIYDGSTPAPHVVVGAEAVALRDLTAASEARPAPSTMTGLLRDWDYWYERITQLVDTVQIRGTDLESLSFAPVVHDPPAIYCAGANYREHVVRMRRDLEFAPEEPYHFVASPQALLGHRGTVRRPSRCRKLDWEVELAIVIGRMAVNVDESRALDHVAGYSVANDVSARDLGRRTDRQPFPLDWLQAKSYATCLPLGPVLRPKEAIADPNALRLSLKVNGAMKQDASTSEMYFSCEEQIAYLSRIVPLMPGDVICTGTPQGTGHETETYLEPGDVMRAEVEGVGVLENDVAGT